MPWKISFGQLDDNIFSYISIVNIFKIFNSCFYGLNNNEVFETFKIFEDIKINRHMLIRYLLNYFFIFIFGFSLCLYYFIINKKENSNKNLIIAKTNGPNLIYNNPEEAKKTKKVMIISILLYLLWIIEELCLDIFIISFKDVDCWMFEFIFLALLYKIIDNNKPIYRHQWLAIIIIVLSIILKIISIITTIIAKEKFNRNENYELGLPILYTTNYWYLLGFFLYLFFIFLRASVNTGLNWLMEKKYVPLQNILLWNGIVGSIFTFISIIISFFIPCKETTLKEYNKNDSDYYKYICIINVNVTDPSKTNDINIYLENFSQYIKEECNWVKEIITLFIGSITFLLFRYYSLFIIKKSPIHFSISIPITFLFQKLLTASYTMLIKQDIIKSYDGIKITKMSLDVIGDIFAIIAFLIYLEIIILNFNKFDHNIKINIDERGIFDEKTISENLIDETIISEN